MSLSLRVPPEKEEMIRRAGSKAGKSDTAFILDAIDALLKAITE